RPCRARCEAAATATATPPPRRRAPPRRTPGRRSCAPALLARGGARASSCAVWEQAVEALEAGDHVGGGVALALEDDRAQALGARQHCLDDLPCVRQRLGPVRVIDERVPVDIDLGAAGNVQLDDAIERKAVEGGGR